VPRAGAVPTGKRRWSRQVAMGRGVVAGDDTLRFGGREGVSRLWSNHR